MGAKTGITWANSTWNPTVGCSIVSPGCTNCYAMRDAYRMEHNPSVGDKYKGLTTVVNGRPVWNGVVRLHESALDQPLRWREPRLIFVNSMSDVFHESLGWDAIDRIFAIVVLSPRHIFQFLTKRSGRMLDYMNHPQTPARVSKAVQQQMGKVAPECFAIQWPPANAHMGVSAERQQEADERIPDLIETKAAVRWVSAEPLLGPIDFGAFEGIDGIVVGGESLRGKIEMARPMNPVWARDIRDQCAERKIAFFFKQWGEWGYDPRVAKKEMRGDDQPHAIDERWSLICVGKKLAGDYLDGVQHHEWPKVTT